MKLRTGEPWMPAPDYGRSLRGLTFNLLVRDIEAALAFQRDVLRAEVVYATPDFAVLRGCGGESMLHADHAYRGHPLHSEVAAVLGRGTGVELRLHGCDPDAATAAARAGGYIVVAEPAAKPHGLREAFVADPGRYVWVPHVPTQACRVTSNAAPGLRLPRPRRKSVRIRRSPARPGAARWTRFRGSATRRLRW
jgi:catechol 2,3-dioxygenase-like lactoylglutathione lyase family enzyme